MCLHLSSKHLSDPAMCYVCIVIEQVSSLSMWLKESGQDFESQQSE